MKNWYCYVCGKKVSKTYYLYSMNDSTDRVFLICEKKCAELAYTKDISLVKITELE